MPSRFYVSLIRILLYTRLDFESPYDYLQTIIRTHRQRYLARVSARNKVRYVRGCPMKIVNKALVSLLLVAIATSARAWDCHTDGKSHPLAVTLQKMDISVQPVGKRFDVTLTIKCVDDRVTIEIPTIKQTFISSEDSRNFTAPPTVKQGEFPTLYPKPPKGDKPSGTSYPCLPPGDQNPPPPTGSPCLPPEYPLGGFVDTVDNAIPATSVPRVGFPFDLRSKAKPPQVCAIEVL